MKITNKRVASTSGSEFYPTPEWVTVALLDNEKFSNEIWEPACGNGAMSKVIEAHGYRVYSTDLEDHGYGMPGHDFLTSPVSMANIITNPPFNLAEEFIHAALSKAHHKVALLLRLAFLEGQGRHKSLYSVKPPSRVWVMSERITFYPGGIQTAGSGTTAYAWFVWDKYDQSGATQLKWLNGYKPK